MSQPHPRVAQVLHDTGVNHVIHRHADLPVAITGPADFAAALGYELSRITKTLFLRSQTGETFAVVVCPVDRRVDFGAVSKAVSARMEVGARGDLAERIGYPPNGVSPLGLDPGVVVLVDETVRAHPTVLIGGGAAGVEVELAPDDLLRLANATLATVTK